MVDTFRQRAAHGAAISTGATPWFAHGRCQRRDLWHLERNAALLDRRNGGWSGNVCPGTLAGRGCIASLESHPPVAASRRGQFVSWILDRSDRQNDADHLARFYRLPGRYRIIPGMLAYTAIGSELMQGRLLSWYTALALLALVTLFFLGRHAVRRLLER